MAKHTLHGNQFITVSADRWDGDSLAFAAAPGTVPSVSFTGPNALTELTNTGSATSPGHGVINLLPGSALATKGLSVSAAILSIVQSPGTSMMFDGNSRITNSSVLTVASYGTSDTDTFNGTIAIDGSSTANLDTVNIAGSGTFHLTGESALLRVGSVGANETIVLDGGMLSLTNAMHFLGTITDSAPGLSRIGPISSVDIYNALDATHETFDRASGALTLFNGQGSEVANLKFAGTGDLYAAPTTNLKTNYIAITAHPSAGTLPILFT